MNLFSRILTCFSFPSELQPLLQSRSHHCSVCPLIILFPSLWDIVSQVIACIGLRQVLSDWIRPCRFARLGPAFISSDSHLASVAARLTFIAWAATVKTSSIVFPTVTPSNLALLGQLGCIRSIVGISTFPPLLKATLFCWTVGKEVQQGSIRLGNCLQ